MNAEWLSLIWPHLQGFIESNWVNFFQDGPQGNQRLLQDLVPVILGEVNDDRYKYREGLVLVRLQNIEEVVILKETHGAVSHLQVISTNAFDDTLEKALNQWLDVLDFADLNNLLKLSQEQRLLNTVSKGPKLE